MIHTHTCRCINIQKGTPWECFLFFFSILHSATTDTAHVPWFSHFFATIDKSALFFCNGYINKTKTPKKQNKEPKKQKTKKQKNKKNKKKTK